MNQNTIQFSKYGYSGIFTELDQIAKDLPNYVNISMCDPPRFGFTLDQTVWNKIDQLKLPTFTEYPSWNGQIDCPQEMIPVLDRLFPKQNNFFRDFF